MATRETVKKTSQTMEMIRQLMKAKGIRRGNPKDYCVLGQGFLMDYRGQYRVTRIDVEPVPPLPEGVEPVVDNQPPPLEVLHKRYLHNFIEDWQAAIFWNKKYGIRVTPKLPPKGEVKHGEGAHEPVGEVSTGTGKEVRKDNVVQNQGLPDMREGNVEG